MLSIGGMEKQLTTVELLERIVLTVGQVRTMNSNAFQVGKWRFFMWVAPSVAVLVGCLATIANVKGGYVHYDPTHNKVFTDRHDKDLMQVIEEEEERRKKSTSS